MINSIWTDFRQRTIKYDTHTLAMNPNLMPGHSLWKFKASSATFSAKTKFWTPEKNAEAVRSWNFYLTVFIILGAPPGEQMWKLASPLEICAVRHREELASWKFVKQPSDRRQDGQARLQVDHQAICHLLVWPFCQVKAGKASKSTQKTSAQNVFSPLLRSSEVKRGPGRESVWVSDHHFQTGRREHCEFVIARGAPRALWPRTVM